MPKSDELEAEVIRLREEHAKQAKIIEQKCAELQHTHENELIEAGKGFRCSKCDEFVLRSETRHPNMCPKCQETWDADFELKRRASKIIGGVVTDVTLSDEDGDYELQSISIQCEKGFLVISGNCDDMGFVWYKGKWNPHKQKVCQYHSAKSFFDDENPQDDAE